MKAHAKWFVLVAVVLAGLVAALSGCSDLGGPTNSNGNVPGGSGENGVKLGTVTLTYDLESKSGTAEFVPNAQVSGEANIDTLTGLHFVWGKSTYDKRGVIPSLGVPGPAAIVSLAIKNTSTYEILGPYMQFPTTLTGFKAHYPTAADAAPLELGDPDTPSGGVGATGVYPPGGWQRWVCENDGGLFDTGAGATNWVPLTTDHGWASSYFGQTPVGVEATDDFLSQWDSLASDKTYTIRFLELGKTNGWGPYYDEDGDTTTVTPPPASITAIPGLYAQPNATPPNPIACAIPMRFQQMPNGETPTRVTITATLYADALLDTNAGYTGPKNARWDDLKTTIGGFNPLADIITSVTRDSTGNILVGWLDSSAGSIPGVNFMFQFSRLGSDLTMLNTAVIPLASGVRTVGGAINIRGFAVNTTRNRAYVAIDTGFGTGTVFSFDATTGAQADGGTGLNVAAAEGIGSFTAGCVIDGLASDDANGLVYVSYGDGVPPPATVARVVGYPLSGTFVPTTPKACASPAAGIALFQHLFPFVGGKLGVDGTGRVFVSSGINPSPNGIVRLVRSGANLNYDTTYDIDNLTTVPAIVPAAQIYDMFAVAPDGSVTVFLFAGGVPSYDVSYSPDLPGDNGPFNFDAAAMPGAQGGFVHFSASGVWDASTWLYIINTDGSTGILMTGGPTSMFQAGAGPLATHKSVLIYDGGLGAAAEMSFLNM